MKNILVTSLGTTWSIIPELIGFFNHQEYDFFKNHNNTVKINQQRLDYKILTVTEVWVITTNGEQVAESLKILDSWIKKMNLSIKIKLFSYTNLIELNSIDEINPMSDLTFRVVLHAKEHTDGGKLYLSLAGGRKNMSADMQNAANIFGADALIHIMDDGEIDKIFSHRNTKIEQIQAFNKIPGKEVSCFTPVVLQGKIQSSPIIYAEPKIINTNYPISIGLKQETKTNLFKEIKKRRSESANSLLSIYKKQIEGSQTAYSAFQLLPPEIVAKLQSDKIGENAVNKQTDLAWLKQLPKAELHCHFGGILSAEEIIEVASVNKQEINRYFKANKDFHNWFLQLEQQITLNDLKKIPIFDPKKNIKEYWLERGIPEPIGISTFISAFQNKPHLLQEYIYNSVGTFKNIGILAYEKLGDLQGSSLLQNEATIRKTCQILKRQCKRHNIKYIEVRCSPVNYTRSDLKAEDVVIIMMDEFKDQKTIFKLLFIASRHGKNKPIQEHINLALRMLDTNDQFKKMFVGFDLAGAESAKRPEEVRELFLKILEKSIPTTIHAGENMPVKSIWEAVYHLSAERIGHGLTLNDDIDLKRRFKERKIAIELCPSSNDQIIGYHNYLDPVKAFENKIYPIKQYLNDGLKVTINTDDPGISLTNLSNEYYKAASMTKGGLTKWEILQINRNGFKYGFLTIEEKKELLLKVESDLFELLKKE